MHHFTKRNYGVFLGLVALFATGGLLLALASTAAAPVRRAAAAPGAQDSSQSVAVCWEKIVNGSFEDNTAWVLPLTEYQAGYSTERVRTGNRSMRTGITIPQDNRFSYSSASQTVTLPANASGAELRFWLFPLTSEPSTLSLPENPLGIEEQDAGSAGDVQLVLILNQSGQELERLVMQRSNAQTWQRYSFDVSHYAGQTIQVYFGVYNNGWAGITAMFVDDVTLGTCPEPPTATPTATSTATATPTPSNTPTATPTSTPSNTPTNTPTPSDTPTPTNTPTPSDTPTPTNTPTPSDTPTATPTATPSNTPTNTPTPTETPTPTDTPVPPVGQIYVPIIIFSGPTCSEAVVNGTFEAVGGWQIPVTEFPAGYSTGQAYNGAWSMRAGILSPPDNRFSYSSANQPVTLPANASEATLRFWLFPLSSESNLLALPRRPLAMEVQEAASSGDAQLVLILDANGQERERLLVQRQNNQTWLQYSFDLSAYAGETIQLYFGVYNNGWGGVTAMYVDDVSLEVCVAAP